MSDITRHKDVPAKPIRRDLTVVGSEEDLVRRAKRGEGAALRALAEQELPRVERLLGRILGPRPDFEDLVQNVFLEMCRSIGSFEGRSRFSTWLGGITVRISRRALRPSAYESRRGEMPEMPDPARSPEAIVSSHQRLVLLHSRLDRLAPAKRIAFSLWALDERSPEEIAELTDTKVHTVRSRIYHARQALMRDPVVRRLLGSDP